MSEFTKEDLAELALLESEVSDEAAADELAAKRQHLDALRMRKRHTKGDKKHGRDFAVIETKIGNFTIRKPQDVEIDKLLETPDDRAAQEAFVTAVTLEPSTAELQALFPANPGLANAVCPVALDLVRIVRSEETKK